MKSSDTIKLSSTKLIQNNNCSILLKFVPSSAVIEKNFRSRIVETFTLKTLEAIMCNNSFWMSWCVYLCPTCPWRCLVMFSSFVPRRYKIWVRLPLLSRTWNGIPWWARYLRHLITSSKSLRSTYLCWVIWSSIISSTLLQWGTIKQ